MVGFAARADAQGQVSLSWTKRYAGAGGSTPISCPTVSFCMLGATHRSGAAFAGDPFTGPFRKTGPVPSTSARACATRRLCLTRTMAQPDFINDVILVSGHPTARRTRYHRVVKLRGGITDLVCASPTFCAGIASRSSAFSRRPGRARSWRVLGRAGDVETLSCTAQELCAATVTFSTAISVIQRPLDAGSRWRTVHPAAVADGDSMGRPACAGASSCLVPVGGGALLASSHVQDGRRAWLRSVVYQPAGGDARSYIGDMACASVTLCVGYGARTRGTRVLGYDFLYSTNPFSGSPADWVVMPLPRLVAGERPMYSAPVCASADTCMFATGTFDRRLDAYKMSVLTVRLAVGTTAVD
jgi:hypothetical protein